MIDRIVPDWPSPANVSAMFTTRNTGAAVAGRNAYAGLNLAAHVDDDPRAVQLNRNQLRQYLPDPPRWLTQVHGSRPIWVDSENETLEGDAAMSRHPGVVCAVLVADCLPVLLCDRAGSVVGAVHAGWRGLARGVIENTIQTLREFSHSEHIIAWLGPAISSRHFEVGDEVRTLFTEYDHQAAHAFFPGKEKGKWHADLFALARQRLAHAGVSRIYGGNLCTYSNPEKFYSYRRDGKTGRMAGLLWMTQFPDSGST
ncbi:peptidoglycan editing factor PgeF [Nitrosomonas sp. HPC101]|uniref:peptidoglycan editing factor PgeF n=1 Tax=Nitrosomonas sp. HPC101 TaxID=1658667 RepID=UPI00136FFC41|nr:peptidoglycan editing factor PgeF [Nitrosomonas sp. HPC101]MXS86200.1 peptidoglycan editing factor PgeF [Nitrosomonas sp. HPC101]